MSSTQKSGSQKQPPPKLKYISLVGIEFEGAWESEPSYNCDVKDDGSVEMCECDFDERDPDCLCSRAEHIGEVCTDEPMVPTIERLSAWISRCIPDYVNSTCGTHVHFSFDKHHLDYYSYIAERVGWLIKEWPGRMPSRGIANEVRERLNYCNYCKGMDDHVDQLLNGSDRYTALNFASLHQHGTLEARFLPGMDSGQSATRAIWNTLTVIEEAIAAGISSRKRVVLDLSIPIKTKSSLKVVNTFFGTWDERREPPNPNVWAYVQQEPMDVYPGRVHLPGPPEENPF